jgi:hypothetical protein
VNPWLVLLIAVVAVVVAVWLAAEIEQRWLYPRRRERGLRRIYDDAQREADADRELRNGGSSRNRW